MAVFLVKAAFHFFALSSAVFLSTFHSMYSHRDRLFVVSGKGSFGLSRTKKVGAASRLGDNLHTSISLQVVFSP
ncbi:hypothetical protein [Bacteroides thetaiotaomicron]|uniref:hypothetical protein n=1 Tax=Bacteroides thetaiotaomicron TaxID=818 RepID=UPI0035622406